MRIALNKCWAALLLCYVTCFSIASAQLVVDDSFTGEQLAEILTGFGVKVTNVTLTCPDTASGYFNGSTANLGIPEGVLLTTGSANAAIGPNNVTGKGFDRSSPGDTALSVLAAQNTFDACILEFDVEPVADTLRFNYVFASEEYSEFVCNINDVFAFFISGPNPSGGTYNEENIALVPGTATPVSINTVNNGLYNRGVAPAPCVAGIDTCPCNPQYFFDNENPIAGTSVEYDGFTTVLEARALVIPCQSYRLKLAIADASDGVFDSGVFLEGGSLSSNGIGISPSSDSVGVDYAVEGCINGVFTFFRRPITQNPVVIKYNVGGDATRGVDYIDIPDSVIIPAGQGSTTLSIVPIVDGINEFRERVVLNFIECVAVLNDSNFIYIYDEFVTGACADKTYCKGYPEAEVGAFGGITYNWYPAFLFEDNTLDTAIIKREYTWQNRTVYVDITNSCGTYTDTVNVTFEQVIDLDIKVGNSFPSDTGVFLGSNLQLEATGSRVERYSWWPAQGLSCVTCADPIFFGDQGNTYMVEVEDRDGCLNYDTIFIEVIRQIDIFPPNAFTPNNDGQNDFFEIITFGIASIDEYKIFNRWGNEVFGQSGVEVGASALKYNLWDGFYKGKIQPVGTYAFFIEATGIDGTKVFKQGDFSILK